MDRNLNTMFPDAKGYKTWAGAARKLEAFSVLLDENNALRVVVQRPADGLYLPVVIIGEKNEWICGPVCGSGICVCRA